MIKQKKTLMTWMAIERDPSLFANVLKVAQEQYDIEHIYYLYTNGKSTKTSTLIRNLEYMEHKYVPRLEPIPIDINNPSSLEELYEKIQETFKQRPEMKENLIISTTAGTPAMYATWILLYAGGFFPADTELFSAQRELKKGKELFENKEIILEPSQKLQRINFKIDTYLSQLRRIEEQPDKSELSYKYNKPKSQKGGEAYDNILKFAKVSGVPLLIYGERGVGKSTAVKEWIRNLKVGLSENDKKVGLGGKDNLPIVQINCGSLDPNLAEARIFGYVPGAYTGAQKNGADGLIEQARNGILFLDEVQDLKKDVQRKLLQVFNDHCYTKVGDTSNKEIEIKFDLICATNKSEKELKQMLDMDFYDRICVYKVVLPPLRERREDIPDLWYDTWRNVCLSTGHTELINEGHINNHLSEYFAKSNLYGNIRSLRKIAFLKIAFLNAKNDKEILEMLADEEEQGLENDSFSQDSFFSKYESMPWIDAEAQFRKDLAQWSEQKYGSLSNVEKKLGWKKRNLQNALKGND
jgi:transcriptional regulator with AAA-type ATPase domain